MNEKKKVKRKGMDLLTIMVMIFFILVLVVVIAYIGIHAINKGVSIPVSLPG